MTEDSSKVVPVPVANFLKYCKLSDRDIRKKRQEKTLFRHITHNYICNLVRWRFTET